MSPSSREGAIYAHNKPGAPGYISFVAVSKGQPDGTVFGQPVGTLSVVHACKRSGMTLTPHTHTHTHTHGGTLAPPRPTQPNGLEKYFHSSISISALNL